MNGFVIQAMPLARLALSAHLVGLMGSTFLIALGASWPALALSPRTPMLGVVLAIYGFCGGWLVYIFASASGAAGMFPIAGGGSRGGPWVEGVMSVALLTVALALFALASLVLDGVRKHGNRTGPRDRSATTDTSAAR